MLILKSLNMAQQLETVTEEVTSTSQAQPEQVITTRKVVTPTTPPIRTEHPQVTYEKKKALFKTEQVIWFVVGIIEVLLAFRIAMKLFGANPVSPFTNLIYSISEPFAFLFSGIFRSTITGQSVLEWSSFIAMAVYAIVAIGLIQLMRLFKPVTPEEVIEHTDNHV
jgi:uncharacterized protein YggT (Ycf19 family)